MKIKKKLNGQEIILDYRRVRKYPHGYTLYNVYKMLGKTKRLFLYRTCLDTFQLQKIVNSQYIINEEEDDLCM